MKQKSSRFFRMNTGFFNVHDYRMSHIIIKRYLSDFSPRDMLKGSKISFVVVLLLGGIMSKKCFKWDLLWRCWSLCGLLGSKWVKLFLWHFTLLNCFVCGLVWPCLALFYVALSFVVICSIVALYRPFSRS